MAEYCFYGLNSKCFACYQGKCYCLTDTRFKNGVCPFYKTSDEVDSRTKELIRKEIARENFVFKEKENAKQETENENDNKNL